MRHRIRKSFQFFVRDFEFRGAFVYHSFQLLVEFQESCLSFLPFGNVGDKSAEQDVVLRFQRRLPKGPPEIFLRFVAVP